jgi:hypothetical protein
VPFEPEPKPTKNQRKKERRRQRETADSMRYHGQTYLEVEPERRRFKALPNAAEPDQLKPAQPERKRGELDALFDWGPIYMRQLERYLRPR